MTGMYDEEEKYDYWSKDKEKMTPEPLKGKVYCHQCKLSKQILPTFDNKGNIHLHPRECTISNKPIKKIPHTCRHHIYNPDWRI